MFKRVVIYTVVLLYSNAMLFLPKAAGADIFDTRDHKRDEINSLFEYIYQIILGYKDSTPEDEDGNTSSDCLVQKVSTEQVCHTVVIEPVQQDVTQPENKLVYSVYNETTLCDGIRDITIPPPKA